MFTEVIDVAGPLLVIVVVLVTWTLNRIPDSKANPKAPAMDLTKLSALASDLTKLVADAKPLLAELTPLVADIKGIVADVKALVSTPTVPPAA